MEKTTPPAGLADLSPSPSPASTKTQGGIGDLLVPAYNIVTAEQKEREELNMSLWQAVLAEARLIRYACGFSGTIVMEGYGLAMITYVFSFKSFRDDYGEDHTVSRPLAQNTSSTAC